MRYDLVKVTAENDWRDYHAIRRQALWDARGRSGYDENHADEHLICNHPLLLKFDGRPIGTTRIDDLGNGTAVVRLVAIAVDMQRQGHGRVLSALVELSARRLGIDTLFVNAAADAVGFYEKMGWEHYSWDAAEPAAVATASKQMRKTLSHGS